MSEITDLLQEKENTLNLLHNYEKKICELKKKLLEIDKTLFKTCQHEWKRDYDSYNDFSKKICLHCGLRDYIMYR